MRPKKILYVNWGGLGDHLQFSTLPEAFDKIGYDTYISSSSQFRSMETYDLVWKLNPYIKGFSNEQANCGHIGNFQLSNKGFSMNRNWEIVFGADNNGNLPIIYYEPKNIENYKNSLLIDINSFSCTDYNYDKIKEVINNNILSNNFDNIYYLLPSKANYSKSHVLDINCTQITTDNIFEYCDLINSCKKFICVWSGSSVLAAAINKNNAVQIDCFIPRYQDNNWGVNDKSFYWYNNINYLKC